MDRAGEAGAARREARCPGDEQRLVPHRAARHRRQLRRGKADDAAVHSTRCVAPDEFAVLLKHLQPAAKKVTASVPRPRNATASPAAAADVRSLPAAHVSASLGTVRAWARANGYDVGERGRLPAEVTDAFKRAHQELGTGEPQR